MGLISKTIYSPYLFAKKEDDTEKKVTPNPTEMDLNSKDFIAVWEVIKNWDVKAPDYYSGYTGANGSHVMMILEKLRPALREEKIDQICD